MIYLCIFVKLGNCCIRNILSGKDRLVGVQLQVVYSLSYFKTLGLERAA